MATQTLINGTKYIDFFSTRGAQKLWIYGGCFESPDPPQIDLDLTYFDDVVKWHWNLPRGLLKYSFQFVMTNDARIDLGLVRSFFCFWNLQCFKHVFLQTEVTFFEMFVVRSRQQMPPAGHLWPVGPEIGCSGLRIFNSEATSSFQPIWTEIWQFVNSGRRSDREAELDSVHACELNCSWQSCAIALNQHSSITNFLLYVDGCGSKYSWPGGGWRHSGAAVQPIDHY